MNQEGPEIVSLLMVSTVSDDGVGSSSCCILLSSSKSGAFEFDRFWWSLATDISGPLVGDLSSIEVEELDT